MDPEITDHVPWGIILPQLKNSSHIQGSCDMIQVCQDTLSLEKT